MNRFQDHPVFASEDAMQAPLSAAELKDLRKLLEREKRRSNLANSSDFTEGPEGQINHTKLAERIYRARRDRERVFDDEIFADPAWDLLLDLFVRSSRNEQVSISSACHAASVPEATALRYLKALTEKNYVERISHPNDRRSTTLKMTPLGSNLMIEWLEHFRSNR
jgi:Fic family protein